MTAEMMQTKIIDKIIELPIEMFRFDIIEDGFEADFHNKIIPRDTIMNALKEAMMNQKYNWYLLLHMNGWRYTNDAGYLYIERRFNIDDASIIEYHIYENKEMNKHIRICIDKSGNLILGNEEFDFYTKEDGVFDDDVWSEFIKIINECKKSVENAECVSIGID